MSYSSSDIPEKARRVLNIIFLCLFLVVIRVWFLAVIQHDKKQEEAQKPRLKVVVEPSKRATIRDRFNIPLAINKIRYRASVIYSEFRKIPSFVWEKDDAGNKIKIQKRKEYINALTQLLAKELNLDPERLEDLIHSKAALYFHLPFVIKEELSEQEYYRLKMLEREWVGIHVQIIPQRTYPLEKVGADVIGYMGSINQREYENAIGKIKQLEKIVKDFENGECDQLSSEFASIDQAKKKLKELRDRSYTLSDYVGKSGIEGFFDAQLRGFHGKSYYQADAKGNYLRKLPESRSPIPGKRFILTISSTLQEYAEQLLAQSESMRKAYTSHPSQLIAKQPWIKGGSIIAMDPNNGEIVALASFPRIDPNDFISSGNKDVIAQKKENISKWLENEEYLAKIWDQHSLFEKEQYDSKTESFTHSGIEINWSTFLEKILSEDSAIRHWLTHTATLKDAIYVQRAFQTYLSYSGQTNPYWLLQVLFNSSGYGDNPLKDVRQVIEENIELQNESPESQKKLLETYLKPIPSDFEKILLIDLCRVAVNEESFSPQLLQEIGSQKLETYRNASAAYSQLEPLLKHLMKKTFHDSIFKSWRAENGKKLLQEKRKEEKALHKYAKPYIDYLDQKENEMFKSFWEDNRAKTLLKLLKEGEKIADFEQMQQPYQILQLAIESLTESSAEEYLKSLRTFQDLTRPLFGSYPGLRKDGKMRLEKHMAMAFYPKYGFGYGRSYAFRQTTPQGSIFKLVTGYAALQKKYQLLSPHNITPTNLNPLTMVDLVKKTGSKTIVGYHANGTPIYENYKGGRIPASIIKSIGTADIRKAIETSSNPYFALLAGDVLEDPEELIDAAKAFGYGEKCGIELCGEIAGKLPTDLAKNRTGLYATAIGQHSLDVTPLQTAVMLSAIANGGKVLRPKVILARSGEENSIQEEQPYIRREIFMPKEIRKLLLEGMQAANLRIQKEGISNLCVIYKEHPQAINDFVNLKHDLVGKTSTAEWMERLLPLEPASKCTHIWFGAISFDPNDDQFEHPELVVVVYLRFGKYGKDAAPIAAQIVQKWREIRQKNQKPHAKYGKL